MTTRMRPLWIAALAAAVAGLTGCPDEKVPRLYQKADKPPPGLLAETTPAMWHEVGAGERVDVTESLIGSMKLLGAQMIYDKDGKFRGVNFSVYSQRAEKVRLLLFDSPEANRATREFDMARIGDVWTAFVEGVGLGQHYGYLAWGPNWQFDEKWYPGSIHGFRSDVDLAGNRFNPNKLLFDPYCKIFHRGHDWGKGSAGTGPDRISSTLAAAMKCRVVKSEYQWSEEESAWRQGRVDDTLEGHRWNELVFYEVHPKGFTANSSSGVKHLGTFRGFAEKAQYLKDLGINAVELLPPFEKAGDAGYWGYNTLGFFAPEHSYLARNEGAEGVDEFKYMVDELHKHGIEVILDVVYNHSGEGGLWRQKIYPTNNDPPWNLDPQEIASLFGFRGLDNALYYALPINNGREYCDYTGVGNTMRCNSPPMQRLIIDSLRYWVEEMHVDGFRFDLAPALGGRDGEYANCPTSSKKDGSWGIAWDPKNTVIQSIIDDPVMRKYNTRIIAEPWGGGYYAIGQFPPASDRSGFAWGEWNNRFRDWWRSFVNEGWALNARQDGTDFGSLTEGTKVSFQHNGRKPYHSLNFITVHDGMTMYDLVSYDKKVNGCGPLNPRCCSDPLSSFCKEAEFSGTDDNRSNNWAEGQAKCGGVDGNNCGWGWTCYVGRCVPAEDFKRQQMRNWFMAMMFSHGTPMLFGGDEFMRTQYGNNNTYTVEADNPYSWHDWGAWEGLDDRKRMKDFVAQSIRFRKEHAYALAPIDWDAGAPFAWKNASNNNMACPDDQNCDWKKRHIMIHYYDATKGPELAILVNMEDGDVTFQLPQGKSWRRLIDTQMHFDTLDYLNEQKVSLAKSANATLENPFEVPGTSYGAKARSIVVLEAK